MAEKVAKPGVSKEKGYLYYLGKDGNVWRSQMARGASKGGSAEKVAEAGLEAVSGTGLYVRHDIATEASISKRVSHMENLRS